MKPTESSAKPAFLSAAVAKLRGVAGLVEALAAAANVPVPALRSKQGFLDACAKVASEGASAGPPVLIPEKSGRRTVGFRPRSHDDVVRMARGAVSRESFPVLVDGPMPRGPAAACGLRDARRRKWSGDPVVDAALHDLSDRLHDAWAPFCVRAPAGSTWVSALVSPRLFEPRSRHRWDPPSRRVVVVIVVERASPLIVGCLQIADEALPRADLSPEGVATLVRGVELAISQGAAVDPKTSSRSPGSGRRFLPHRGEDVETLCDVIGAEFPTDTNAERFRRRIAGRLDAATGAALARFRRTLPEPLQGIAGLVGRRFDEFDDAWAFLSERTGWMEADAERVVQAYRALPWLRRLPYSQTVVDAIVDGRPMEEVLRAATGREKPYHRKTVASLASTWRIRHDKGPAPADDLAAFALAVDAYHRSDPHRRALSDHEVRAAADTVARSRWSSGEMGDDLGSLIAASRDARGIVRPLPDGVHDFLRWLAGECDLLLSSLAHGHRLAGPRMALAIACPPQRRHAALLAASERWHARTSVFVARRRAAILSARERTKAKAEIDPDAFPHVFPDASRHDGVEIRALRDWNGIEREGEEMDHCVGTFVDAAYVGRSMIVSLSSKEGRTTAEISVESSADFGDAAVIVQHKGVDNVDPFASHERALRRALKDLDPKTVSAVRERSEAIARRVGFGSRELSGLDRLQVEAVMDEIHSHVREFLSGPWKGLSKAAFRDAAVAYLEGGS